MSNTITRLLGNNKNNRPVWVTAEAVTCEIVKHVVQKLPGSVWFLVQIEDVLGQRVPCTKNSIKNYLKFFF